MTTPDEHPEQITGEISEKGPIGSYVIAIWHGTLSWAVAEIVRTLSPDQISKLKVPSGEHLAAILVTSFLGVTPRSIDSAGETDLIFETPRSLPGDALGRRLGLGKMPFADFEIKSLPGRFREFNAAIDGTQEAGKKPDGRKKSRGTRRTSSSSPTSSTIPQSSATKIC